MVARRGNPAAHGAGRGEGRRSLKAGGAMLVVHPVSESRHRQVILLTGIDP